MQRPTIGESLPRAADAYSGSVKWADWILADRGHGPEWKRVFQLDLADASRLFVLIKAAVLVAPIQYIRPRGDHGVVCGVEITLTINGRTAPVRTSWHYTETDAPPRLVTAYPTP